MPRPPRSRPGLTLLAALLATSLAACATARLDDDPAAYAEAEAALEQRLTRSPDDGDALRDLGIIHVRTRRYARAHELLTRAFARDAEDPRTLYHLGLASEALARYDTALRVYGQYPAVPRLSPYRR
ncbi:MAG: tetratricopeptide repeat protein, partial [Rhodothermales bacterium]|nr:tetratricopeptide repeat protein [Rhodothermales bacterium]